MLSDEETEWRASATERLVLLDTAGTGTCSAAPPVGARFLIAKQAHRPPPHAKIVDINLVRTDNVTPRVKI